MSEEVTIPEANTLVPMVSALIGKDIFVRGEDSGPEPASIAQFLTVFVGDEGEPLILAGGDASFAYYAGAALALIPKGRAEDAIGGAEPDPDLVENYREIMNVLTRVVNDQGGPHVRLVPGSTADLAELPEPKSGRAYSLEVDGYGTGNLCFWKF